MKYINLCKGFDIKGTLWTQIENQPNPWGLTTVHQGSDFPSSTSRKSERKPNKRYLHYTKTYFPISLAVVFVVVLVWICAAGEGTQGLACCRQTLHRCTTHSALLFVLNKISDTVPTGQASPSSTTWVESARKTPARVRKHLFLSEQGIHKGWKYP